MGSVTGKEPEWVNEQRISTHTLRGERDEGKKFVVTVDTISTHTLRGERDKMEKIIIYAGDNFNSHAPWGA